MPCDCERCMKKIPSPGFWRAPRAAAQVADAERTEMEYWMEAQCGYDPKRGNPALDDTIERQRNPEEIKALLSRTRKAYPGAYRR